MYQIYAIKTHLLSSQQQQHTLLSLLKIRLNSKESLRAAGSTHVTCNPRTHRAIKYTKSTKIVVLYCLFLTSRWWAIDFSRMKANEFPSHLSDMRTEYHPPLRALCFLFISYLDSPPSSYYTHTKNKLLNIVDENWCWFQTFNSHSDHRNRNWENNEEQKKKIRNSRVALKASGDGIQLSRRLCLIYRI